MRAIPIVKMSGTGNDFIMVDNRDGLIKEADQPAFVKAACPRRVSAARSPTRTGSRSPGGLSRD